MSNSKKPGEIADRSGEYMTVGPRDGKVSNGRQVSIDVGDKMPPTQKPNQRWKRKGPKER